MPFIPQNVNYNNSRFPTTAVRKLQPNVFPNDLRVDGRDLCMVINFQEYSVGQQFDRSTVDVLNKGIKLVAEFVSPTVNLIPDNYDFLGLKQGINNIKNNNGQFISSRNLGNIVLPIPKKINDTTTLTWNEESLAGVAAKNIPGVSKPLEIISATSFMTGATINPFLFMLFQRPNFKEYVLQWTLTPNTPQESTTILNIVNSLKKASLPQKSGVLLKYPTILQINLQPSQLSKVLTFKPCAIISVQVDYTGAGVPSFFKNTKLPTVVNLSLSIKEIKLWDKSDL